MDLPLIPGAAHDRSHPHLTLPLPQGASVAYEIPTLPRHPWAIKYRNTHLQA